MLNLIQNKTTQKKLAQLAILVTIVKAIKNTWRIKQPQL